jgi:NitT/TauT family transport system substrate-binding protein
MNKNKIVINWPISATGFLKLTSFAGGHFAVIAFVVVSFFLVLSCINRPKQTNQVQNTENKLVPEKNQPISHLKLLPYWIPSAQFAGYYVGIEKGIFQKYGIELEILKFDPIKPVPEVLKVNKPDVALFWLVDALKLRAAGIELVNIAQLSYRSSLMLITKKKSGISRIEDMNGKKAGIWIGFEIQPKALFKKFNLDVRIIPIGTTNNLFLQDGVDILNANWFDEYHSVLNNGMNEDELNKFFFSDYGLNFLEDGIYALSNQVKENPGLSANFVRATLESWNYAFEHQEEAINTVVKYAKTNNQPVNRSHQRWILQQYKTLYFKEGSRSINTDLSEKDYLNVQQILLEGGFIKEATPFATFFKPYCITPKTN